MDYYSLKLGSILIIYFLNFINKWIILLIVIEILNIYSSLPVISAVICGGDCGIKSSIVDSSIINAGDGSHEHPTQALLDALTIKNKFKNFSKLKIAICGDILHSRVARSNIIILSKLGAKINVIGPK